MNRYLVILFVLLGVLSKTPIIASTGQTTSVQTIIIRGKAIDSVTRTALNVWRTNMIPTSLAVDQRFNTQDEKIGDTAQEIRDWVSLNYLTEIQADAKYIQTEVDPIFTSHPAFGISSGNVSTWNNISNTVSLDSANWNTAFSWGPHAGLYALLAGSYSNPTWINSLSWLKITSTTTTISGYGITDAVPTSRTLTVAGTTFDLSANRTFSPTTTEIPEGNNLYYTDTRARAAFTAGTGISISVGGSISSTIAAQIQSDYTQANTSALDYIKNKPFGIKVYDKSGAQRSVNVKILCDTFSVNAGNDYTINISALGFTQIFSITATASKATSTGYSCPGVNIDHFTTSTVYLDFTQGNNALPVLAILFPGTIFVSDFTGLKVALTIIGY